MSDDDWVTAATENADLVAELLLKLRAPPSNRPRTTAIPQSWTIHQRRSRTQPMLLPASNKSEPSRTSPSTPLSWSGATSISGVPIVDVVDSTQPNHNRSDFSRSKVTPSGETTPSKRPRKKKTLAALKEEEVLLMEEQNNLKRKLATLQATYEKKRKENERLKKMKLDSNQVEPQGERAEALKCGDFEAAKDKVVLPDLNVPAGEDA